MNKSQNPQPISVDRFTAVTTHAPEDRPGVRTVITCDHAAIMRWASRHGAEPATGEQTRSGPAARHVNDTGAGIRFNFPGFAPFRPITWQEWFDNFDEHNLAFVFEETDEQSISSRARELWRARGGGEGGELEDWLAAERELQQSSGPGTPGVRYRLIKQGEGPRQPSRVAKTPSL